MRQKELKKAVIIGKSLSEAFFKMEGKEYILTLYHFYYYTAKWQKTSTIKATNKYVENKLGWNHRTVLKYRKILTDMGLIKTVSRKNKFNRMEGHFVYVNYIWGSDDSTDNEGENNNEDLVQEPEVRLSQKCIKRTSNALSVNSINALSANKVSNNKLLETRAEKDPALAENFSNKNSTRKSLSKTKQETTNSNRNLIILLNHWNEQPHLPKHLNEETKTFKRIVKNLNIVLKTYSLREVVKAITTFNSLVELKDELKFNPRCSFADFLILSDVVRNQNKFLKDVKSWLEESLDGLDSMLEDFGRVKKCKYPQLALSFESEWIKFMRKRGEDINTITPAMRNSFAIAAEKIVDIFIARYSKNFYFKGSTHGEPYVKYPSKLLPYLFKLLDKNTSNSRIHCGYLTGDFLYETKFPEYCIKSGCFKK